MIDEADDETFREADEPKSSRAILSALKKAEDAFRDWQTTCEVIDRIYDRDGYDPAGRCTGIDGFTWQDSALDLFWSSFEILKVAVYARPPQPVVAPLFKDNKRLFNTAAEMLERCAVSVFKRADMNEIMVNTRDDLLFAGRGAQWVRFEVEKGEKKACIEHKDRLDFLHEPVRKWSDNGWVAGGFWMTRKDMRKRFRKTSGDAYQSAKFTYRRDDESEDLETRALTRKAKVWEVWHKADNKVYWVSEGVDVLLDSSDPEIKFPGFFPCPRPAYATLRRRSLIPVPDYERYAIHFDKISELTRRIYLLLDSVKMKGLIPTGGDVGDAVEQLLRSDDDQMLIPVPGAAMMADGAQSFVAWLPLTDIAEAIQGLIAARQELINNFYELSGISDIMRGATEAEETLGAQQLKSQYGSVRVREKSSELQRVAADTVALVAVIIAEKFSQEDMLEMSQMEIPSKAEIEKRVKEIEKAAKEELQALGQKAQEAAQEHQGNVDPNQAKMMLQQAQQQILAKYAPMLSEAEQQVPIEDVMKLLRDDKARSFTFEIESSSTILTDELQEKQSRNEFMGEFATATQALSSLTAMGEPGAKLAGAMLKFVLAPYRAGRDLDGAIDEFIDAAPEMAAAAQAAQNGGEGQEIAEANKQLAEAEMQKARAATAAVEAKAALDKAEMQRKVAQMQLDAQAQEAKSQEAMAKLQLQLQKQTDDAAEQQAKIDNLTAQTAKILHSIGLDERKQQLDEYTAASNEQARQTDQAMQAQGMAQDASFKAGDQQRAERGEDRADRQQEFTEHSSDRQMTLAEQQARNEGGQ